MVKLQITERVKRTGDKENGTTNSVNWGTVLCRHITAICYHIMPTQEHQAQNLKPVTAKPTDLRSGTRLTEHLRFIYGLSEGCMVHLRPVSRPYGSTTARQKAVRCIIRFILRTVSRTHSQLKVLFGRQHRRHLRRDFLYISYILQFYFLCISFMFYGFIKAITEAVYRWFHFLSTASV